MEAIQDKVLNDYLNQDETDDFNEFVMKKAPLNITFPTSETI